jgi:hypothetical protein
MLRETSQHEPGQDVNSVGDCALECANEFSVVDQAGLHEFADLMFSYTHVVLF